MALLPQVVDGTSDGGFDVRVGVRVPSIEIWGWIDSALDSFWRFVEA